MAAGRSPEAPSANKKNIYRAIKDRLSGIAGVFGPLPSGSNRPPGPASAVACRLPERKFSAYGIVCPGRVPTLQVKIIPTLK
jgi:hypothetical protein